MTKSDRGFTLVEILVSLVVLEVGLLGSAGVLIVADRTMNRARDLEWAVQDARTVADSLAVFGATGNGEFSTEVGVVRWEVTPVGVLSEARIIVVKQDGRSVIDISLYVPTVVEPADD